MFDKKGKVIKTGMFWWKRGK